MIIARSYPTRARGSHDPFPFLIFRLCSLSRCLLWSNNSHFGEGSIKLLTFFAPPLQGNRGAVGASGRPGSQGPPVSCDIYYLELGVWLI